MSDNSPDRSRSADGSSDESASNAFELNDVKHRIDQTVKELNGIRARQNKVRKNINRELHRISPTTSESEQQQISVSLQQLKQEETSFGDEIQALEKQLSDLWSRRRLLEGTPLPAWTPSPAEAEEQRLRWLLLDIKNQQLDAAERCSAADDPEERSRQEGRFNQLRDQYNSVYERLNEIRAARDKNP